MPNYKTEIQWKTLIWKKIKEWNFTGRIKYEKYSAGTLIYFEVEYIVTLPRKPWHVEDKKYNKKAWLHTDDFYFVEIPEAVIYDCNA